MKYLHICNDAPFIDFAIKQFEACNPENNIYLVGLTSDRNELKYIEQKQKVITEIQGTKKYFDTFFKHEYDVLVIHFLDFYHSGIVLNIPKTKKILWLTWGADIYQTGFYKAKLFQPLTNNLVNNLNKYHPFIEEIKNYFRNGYYFLKWEIPPKIKFKRAVERISFCATVIPSEINILRSWKFFKAQQVPFSYTSIEYDFKEVDYINCFKNGDAILVGNSNSPTSNHMDCFKKISAFNIGLRKIFVPLNYGNFDLYTKLITEEGFKILKNNFSPISEFLSKKNYIRILQKCNIAIMAHERQQGVGNVIILLWLGVKIFLSEKNITFSYLKSKGFHIHSIQKDLNENSINEPLSEKEVLINRKLLLQEYSQENVLKKTKILHETISGSFYKNA